MNSKLEQNFFSFIAGYNDSNYEIDATSEFLPKSHGRSKFYEHNNLKLCVSNSSHPLYDRFILKSPNHFIFLQGNFYEALLKKKYEQILRNHIDYRKIKNVLNELNGNFHGFILDFKNFKAYFLNFARKSPLRTL